MIIISDSITNSPSLLISNLCTSHTKHPPTIGVTNSARNAFRKAARIFQRADTPLSRGPPHRPGPISKAYKSIFHHRENRAEEFSGLFQRVLASRSGPWAFPQDGRAVGGLGGRAGFLFEFEIYFFAGEKSRLTASFGVCPRLGWFMALDFAPGVFSHILKFLSIFDVARPWISIFFFGTDSICLYIRFSDRRII